MHRAGIKILGLKLYLSYHLWDRNLEENMDIQMTK